MDYAKSLLVYQLAKDYHVVAQHLKALRRFAESTDTYAPDAQEQHRAAATGWFNQVLTLWFGRFIEEDVFRAVTSRRAAELWVEYVAPLDYAIRVAQGEKRLFGEHSYEAFWIALSQGTLQLPADPTSDEVAH